jgi:hypothetical protein
MKKHLTTALSSGRRQGHPGDEGKFWISYDGAALKLERFSYKDAKARLDGVEDANGEDRG